MKYILSVPLFKSINCRVWFFLFFFFLVAFWKVISSMFIEVLKIKSNKMTKRLFFKKCIFLYTRAFMFFKKPSFCISAYMKCLVVIKFGVFFVLFSIMEGDF